MTDNRPEQFFTEIVARLEQQQPFALATVVHTSGSTPQKAGARAIFLPDGRVLGTLGGGCMEAESRRRALELISGSVSPEHLNTRTPEYLLLDLHLDDDFGWDDGLICGGSAQIFIQPLTGREPLTPNAQPPTPKAHDAYAAAIALKADRRRGMLAMVVAAPSPTDIGRTLLVPEEGPPVGGLEDEALAEELTTTARRLLQEGSEAPRRISLADGAATVFLEPILPRPVLLIMGAGHVGTALTHFASRIGFEVVVVDDRASFANKERLPDADQVIVDSVVEVARRWPKTPETYVVLVTRGHRNDAVALREVIGSSCAYIGMIGSRRKVLTIFEEFLGEGIATPEQLARVHAPIGLDIGALTVDEIAVSIAAELIAVRRGSRRQATSDRRQAGAPQPLAAGALCPEATAVAKAPSAGGEPSAHQGQEQSSAACCLSPAEVQHANSDRTGGGGIPANGDAQAALALRQRERDRAGRPLAASLPDRRHPRGSGPPRR
jgi:xanthine dehydrogenase accessory factor